MKIQDDPQWKCKHENTIKLDGQSYNGIFCLDCGLHLQDTKELEDQFPGLIMQD